jgi:hypothetical protein
MAGVLYFAETVFEAVGVADLWVLDACNKRYRVEGVRYKVKNSVIE